MIRLQRHFDLADGRRGYWADQHRLHRRQRKDAARREQQAEDAEADFAALAAGAIVATEIELRDFRLRLESYETATVDALLSNGEALDLLQVQIDQVLARAHVLEDGRRVFKTRDGTQVFDEHGDEVGQELITPEDIGDSHPVWEDYQPLLEARQELTDQRVRLLEFQDRLDLVNEETRDGPITTDRLEELDAELNALMPPDVRSRLPGMSVETPVLGSVSRSPSNTSADAAAKLEL